MRADIFLNRITKKFFLNTESTKNFYKTINRFHKKECCAACIFKTLRMRRQNLYVLLRVQYWMWQLIFEKIPLLMESMLQKSFPKKIKQCSSFPKVLHMVF